jgi:hypothetical protein
MKENMLPYQSEKEIQGGIQVTGAKTLSIFTL